MHETIKIKSLQKASITKKYKKLMGKNTKIKKKNITSTLRDYFHEYTATIFFF